VNRTHANLQSPRRTADPTPGSRPRSDLRRARKRRGLSLEDVAQQARIPRRYVAALERGDVDVLPHGRFRSGYHRQYRSFLGLPPVAEGQVPTTQAAPEEAPEVTGTTGTMPRGDELPTFRLVASGFAFTLLVVLLLRVGAVVLESPPAFLSRDAEATETSESLSAAAAEGITKAQSIGLRAIEDVRVSITTTEGTIRRGVLPGGESVSIESDGPITLEIADLTRVRVRYNGSRLEPLHNLPKGRRLVFVPEASP